MRFENHYLPRTATKEQIEKAYSRNADKNTLIVGDPVKSKEILLKAKVSFFILEVQSLVINANFEFGYRNYRRELIMLVT